jgi:hypothetical protein
MDYLIAALMLDHEQLDPAVFCIQPVGAMTRPDLKRTLVRDTTPVTPRERRETLKAAE